jgi:putative ABC transport system permease protein
MGVLLAAFGLYGVVAYLVTQRTHEVGVRMALGAATGDVVRIILGRGLALALVGGVLGLSLAAGLSRFLAGFLFGVSPLDPVVFALMPLAMLAVAALASFVPARRAARVDPVVALRQE